jgi:hypothetical protein
VRERIGYLHVPKAAGSSATDAIRRAVLAAAEREGRAISICPEVMDRTLYGSFDEYDQLAGKPREMIFTGPPEELARHDVIVGHFSAASLGHGRHGDDLAALLREPRARLISHYAYWSSWSEGEHASWDPYDASRRAAELSWPDVLAEAAIASQTDNIAARLLLVPHPLIPAGGFIADRHVEELRVEALTALERFGLVDAIEHGADCWSRLGRWAGLEIDVGRRNVTENDHVDAERWALADSPAAMSSLAARTAIDRELWRMAMRRHADARAELDVIEYGDRVAVEQLRKVSGGLVPQDPAWAVETRRDHAPDAGRTGGSISRRLGRLGERGADAWRRAARLRAR